MRVLLIGSTGLLGSAIYESMIKNKIAVLNPSHKQLDICDHYQVVKYFDENDVDYVVHCAGYTDVNNAEGNIEAYNINCNSTYIIANICATENIKLLYFSTDYVFDGSIDRAYIETDKRLPLSTYGYSKAIAEDIILGNTKKHLIIRVSWLYGHNTKCFPHKILKKLDAKEDFYVVDDQIGSPTYVNDIARVIDKIMKLPFGIYHLSNSGSTSWFDYARYLASIAELDPEKISSMKTNLSEVTVARPLNSKLSNSKINSHGIRLRHFEDATKEYFEKEYKRR